MFDVFFLSYGEPNADKNWARLLAKAPYAQRVDGVPSIHEAHRQCAEAATTAFFFTVDADNWIVDDFRFELDFAPEPNSVYVWRCANAVNGLVYGYGAIKLFDAAQARALKTGTVDMTTSAAPAYRIVDVLASETRFNTSPWDAWRSGFREATKLASKVIPNQRDDETETRLQVWTTFGTEKLYGDWCVRGALAGKAFGTACRNDPEALAAINDWDWLRSRFADEVKAVDYLINGRLVHLLKNLGRAQQLVPHRAWADALSEGQLMSKAWLVRELKPLLPLGEVVICGGWVGTLAALMFYEDLPATRITSLDIDPDCALPAQILNRVALSEGRFRAVTQDMMAWNYKRSDTVINTSCDHVADFAKWWKQIPSGKLCVLQNNDFAAGGADHVNTVDSLETFKAMAPMARVYYAGALPFQKYRRFMLIGVK